MKHLYILMMSFLLLSTSLGLSCKGSISSAEKHASEEHIQCAAERISQYYPLLRGKRLALAVNQTSMVGNTHLVDTLLQLGLNIVQIFAPEHGFRGDHSAGEKVHDMTDAKTGIPILSLYGSNRKPKAQQLQNIDCIVFDIQDVGVRFYTYISTMHYLMEASAENGIEMIVLDRPNPNGFYVDGPMRDETLKSFISMHPIPLVHGLTVGELANMIKGEKWIQNSESCLLTIIPCLNYTHDSLYQLPVAPSPNLPNMASVYLYPTLGLFEGTNVSIGRGTPYPFQLLGKPSYKGNFEFTPKSIPGVAENPKFENQACKGLLLRDTAMAIVEKPFLRIEWLLEHYPLNKASEGNFFLASFDKLAGTAELQRQISEQTEGKNIRESWKNELKTYMAMRSGYLLYPDFTNSEKIFDK